MFRFRQLGVKTDEYGLVKMMRKRSPAGVQPYLCTQPVPASSAANLPVPRPAARLSLRLMAR